MPILYAAHPKTAKTHQRYGREQGRKGETLPVCHTALVVMLSCWSLLYLRVSGYRESLTLC